jgi:hypothetical protein
VTFSGSALKSGGVHVSARSDRPEDHESIEIIIRYPKDGAQPSVTVNPPPQKPSRWGKTWESFLKILGMVLPFQDRSSYRSEGRYSTWAESNTAVDVSGCSEDAREDEEATP